MSAPIRSTPRSAGAASATSTARAKSAASPDGAAPGAGAEAKPAAGAEAKPGAEASPYTDFTFADGVEIDAPLIGEFKGIASELKLDQAGAQKVVDLGAKMVKTFGERQATALKAEVAKWGEASKNDTEFGGAKFEENRALANKVLKSFGSAELTELLGNSGLSQHPEVMRLLVKVGAVISEDKFVPAANSGNGVRGPNDYRHMYPNSNHTA